MSIRGYIGVVALVVAAMLCSIVDADAQYLRERGLVREGNRNFNKQNYRTSLNRYNSALEHDATNYEALYNRANAHHQLRKSAPEDSLRAEDTYKLYEAIAADTLLSEQQRAEVLRNLGESLFSDQRYEAALNAFRESLRLNPEDKETKYDYVLTKRIVDQKRQQQQQNNQNDNNQNRDNQQQNDDNQQNNNQQNDQNQQDNQQNDQNSDNQQNSENQNDEQQGDQQQDNGGDEGEDESQSSEGGERPEQLSSDQERMLDAIQAEEDKTQDKLKDKKKALIIPGKKNW